VNAPRPPSPVAVTVLSRPRTRRNSFASRVVASLARSSELVENRGERLGFNSLFSRKTFKPTPFVIVSTGRKTLNLCCWYPESDLFFRRKSVGIQSRNSQRKAEAFLVEPPHARSSFFRRLSAGFARHSTRKTSPYVGFTAHHKRPHHTHIQHRHARPHATPKRRDARSDGRPGAERGHARFCLSSLSHLVISTRFDSISFMILPQVHLRKPCYDFYFL
jgi:hypothetical protein